MSLQSSQSIPQCSVVSQFSHISPVHQLPEAQLSSLTLLSHESVVSLHASSVHDTKSLQSGAAPV
jgi:hypothetical protein